MVEKYSFGIDPIPHHAWNKDRQRKSPTLSFPHLLSIYLQEISIAEIAVTPNNQEIRIYQLDKSANDWTLLDTLNKHDLRVTGIDWAPRTNRIVTCSEVIHCCFYFQILTNFSLRWLFLRIGTLMFGNKVLTRNGRQLKFYFV